MVTNMDGEKPFQCRRCGHCTKEKATLIVHLLKKNKCKPLLEDTCPLQLAKELREQIRQTSVETHPHRCSFCNRGYKHASGLCRHKSVCTKQRQFSLETENVKLKQEVARLSSEKRETVTIHNITNNITNNTYHITIANFYDEDIKVIPEGILKAAIKAPKDFIPTVVKQIHYNVEYPQGMNVKVSDHDPDCCEVFKNSKWTKMQSSKVQHALMDQALGVIDMHVKKNKNRIQKDDKKHFVVFRDAIHDNSDADLKESVVYGVKNVMQTYSCMVNTSSPVVAAEPQGDEDVPSSSDEET